MLSCTGFQHVSIIVEICSLGHSAVITERPWVVEVPFVCDLHAIVSQCSLNQVLLAKKNGNIWSGKSSAWRNADVVTIFVASHTPKWNLPIIINDDPGYADQCQHHSVFFDDTAEFDRIDIVGTQQDVFQWCEPCFTLAPVHNIDVIKAPNQQVWLATRVGKDWKMSMLLKVTKPSGETVWDHCRVEQGKLANIIPQAPKHHFACGQEPVQVDILPRKDCEVVSCIVRTCRDVYEIDEAAFSKDRGEGLAPCPCDRWCAGLDPLVDTGSWSCIEKKTKVTISLEASIPTGQNLPGTNLPGPRVCTHNFNEHSLSDILVPLPDGVQLKLSSAKAIWDGSQCEHPHFLELYIDGSSLNGGSGWAVIAVATDWSGNRSFLGCAAGQTVIDPSSKKWCGAVSEDNIAAEVSALVAAQVAAIVSHLPVIIRPDLQFSRHLVHGSQTSRKIGPIVEVVEILANWGARHVWEVGAHKDDPFNELADSLAKWAAKTGGTCGSIPLDVPHKLATSKDTPQVWMQSMHGSFAATMPKAEDGMIKVENANRKVQCGESLAKTPQTSVGEFACQVVSFNAQSIREDKNNQKIHRRDASVTSRLDMQWNAKDATIIGIQETRTPEGKFRSKHFEIFSSGADESNDCPLFGCEIWFHCQSPIVRFHGRSFYNADFKKTVVHKDPRRLVIKCSAEPITIVVASLHAPCLSQKTDLDQIKQWWKNTCSIFKQIGDSVQIICVDANAPLGAETSPAIGSVGAEPANPQGLIVQEAIDCMDWCVPSTIDGCHEGQSSTWRHPKGAWRRRDYIFISNSIRGWCQKSEVDSAFDSGKTHIDHLPVVLTVKGFLQGRCSEKHAKIDPAKVADPNCQMMFRQALSTLPMPSWDVDIDSHCKIWEQNVLELAQQCFHPGQFRKKRNRPDLSEDTLQAIAFKRHILQLMRNSCPHQHDEYKEELRTIEKEVRQKVHRDQTQWYDVFLQRLQESGEIHDSKAVFAKLHRLGGGKKSGKARPLPMMKDHQGKTAQSFADSQQILFRQFADIEGGKLVTQQELEQSHCHADIVDSKMFDIELMPTLSQVRQVISGMKRGKVPGPNRITTDILKAGGVEIAKQMIPLLTKCTLKCSEPLTWKGGNLIALFKGKGSHSDPKSYRSIFISDTTAKVYHANLRTKLEAAWIKSMDSLQFGGRKGCSPDLAHHILHSFLAWSKVKKVPMATIFVDLQSAFYSVLRQGLFEGEISDSHVCQAMVQLGVSPEEFREITSTVCNEAATSGISQHADQLFRNLFSVTHFRMESLDLPCQTARGTRPGDPIADVLFNMSMMLILRSTRHQLETVCQCRNVASGDFADEVAKASPMPLEGYIDVAFVDDCAFMTFAQSNEQMLHQTKMIQSVFHDEARKRGLKVNYAKGKTEAIMHCHGSHTRAFRKEILINQKATIPIVCENETHQLRIVHGYKHLGSFVQEGASVDWDRRQKIAQARQAWWTLKRTFFNKRAISCHVKKVVLIALVMSRALYNVHVWSWITPNDVTHWSDSIREMISPIVRKQLQGMPAFRFTSAQLCALAGTLDLQEQLHVNRLMYLVRMLTWAPPILWTLVMEVNAPQGWWSHLKASLTWLLMHCPKTVFFKADDDTSDIVRKIALDCRFRAKIKQAKNAAIAYHKRQAEGLIWMKCMHTKLEVFGCVEPVPESKEENTWKCELCNASFRTKRGLAMHSHFAHGYVREAKHYIVDANCQACGKIFHTRARAIVHLETNPNCMNCYRSCMVPMDEDTMLEVEAEDKHCRRNMQQQGWKPTKALKPVVKMIGPTFPPSGTADAVEMKEKWAERINSVNYATALQGFSTGNQEPHKQEAVGPPFVLDSPGGRIQGHGGCAQQKGPAYIAAQLNCKTFFFLHFFSGFRREQDVHWQIENKWVGEGWQVYCISIDLCLCRQHSDLTSKESYDWWLQKARQGYVIGAGGGPPCETYSAARLLPGGPPPLRSHEHEWGLHGLSKKQHLQVLVGSKLVQFMIAFLVELMPLGLCGFLEHPAFPSWAWLKKPASIWSNKVIRQLTKLCCFSMTTFDQCTVGAIAKKPTGLLLLRLPAIRHELRQCGDQGRCNHPAGSHPRLQGRDQEGRFRTSWAKVYPEGLNKILAKGICDFAMALRSGGDRNNFEGYPSFFRHFQTKEFVESHVVQKDFHETTYRWVLPTGTTLTSWFPDSFCLTLFHHDARPSMIMQSQQSVKKKVLECRFFYVKPFGSHWFFPGDASFFAFSRWKVLRSSATESWVVQSNLWCLFPKSSR